MFRFTHPRRESASRARPVAVAPTPHLAAVAILVLLTASGCGLFETRVHHPGNQPPVLTLTSGPVDTVSVPLSWVVNLSWTAVDPDGFVDHYEYAIDPPTAKQTLLAATDTVWVTTHETQLTVHFRASQPDSMGPGATASDFHVFLLRAVDSRGARSPLLVRAFYAYTVAPDVQIVRPLPNRLLDIPLTLPSRVEWAGDDPDGAGTRQPAAYRVRLINMANTDALPYLIDPDSLLREGRANGWVAWRELPGDSTSLPITGADGFLPTQRGLVAVVAVDAAGAVTPYMTLDRNLLMFDVQLPGTTGPRIHIWGPGIDFTFYDGVWSTDPSRAVGVETAAGFPYTLHFEATGVPGHTPVSARWMLDGDPADDTPRASPDDLRHWSPNVPPQGDLSLAMLAPGTHLLYLEVTDDLGSRSLALVKILAVTASLDQELLVVDDTRLEVDKFSGACPNPYTQPWPSAAELDTFLYARGGVPWRCAVNPAGATSAPGLFAGYPFDTLGTRRGFAQPSDAVSLSTLLRYRSVVWLVDGPASTLSLASGPVFQITVLRSMCAPGAANKLAIYAALGGRVWLAGGGAANASLAEFDVASNNTAPTTRYTVEDRELAPGRMMYDAAHVRSELRVARTAAQFTRSGAARGGWSGHGPGGTLSAPDYARLPAQLRLRDPARDPLPPTRAPGREPFYYVTSTSLEFVSRANPITESFDSPGGVTRVESALDTLVEAVAPSLGVSNAPTMLYYHGREHTPFVYSGFSLWDWTRSDAQQLVDFVLQDVWGLSKTAPAVSMARAPSPWQLRQVDRAVRRP